MTAETNAAPAAASGRPRVHAVDVLRGVVMVLMALDHVRVYSGIPAGGPTPGLFFTRWVTHFCAPVFVFLAGTSVFLQERPGTPGAPGAVAARLALSRRLALRGAMLVALELTLVRLAWTFNLDFGGYALAGVLWAIGWSMIALALLRLLPVAVVAAFGLAVVGLHNLVPVHEGPGWLWPVLHDGLANGPIRVGGGGPELFVLYSLVPWVGVMAAGYGFGALLVRPAARRDRLVLAIGAAATLGFVVLRATHGYGDPRPWGAGALPSAFSFLDTSKYPASLQFLLMTLGPTLLFFPLAERAHGWLAGRLALFGRVPLFYYLVHIPLVHLLAIGVSLVREGRVDPWLLTNHPVASPPAPEGYTWSLPLLYAVWAAAIAILYLACRRYSDRSVGPRMPGRP